MPISSSTFAFDVAHFDAVIVSGEKRKIRPRLGGKV
jgi:hypothetical protein